MTKNKRVKRDARARKQRTGEPYVLALRRSEGKTHREQLVDELIAMELDPEEYANSTDEEIVAALKDRLEDLQDEYADAMDAGGWSLDDDAGYGPSSYFARAMNKDD